MDCGISWLDVKCKTVTIIFTYYATYDLDKN